VVNQFSAVATAEKIREGEDSGRILFSIHYASAKTESLEQYYYSRLNK
jgi:hypothetical protein